MTELDNSHVSFFESLQERRNPPDVIAALKRLERMREDGEDVEIARELFGQSQYSEQIYRYVLGGIPCEAIIDEGDSRCGERSLFSVDYDAPFNGDVDSLLVCGFGHGEEVKRGVDKDLRENANGMITIFGINGFGRA